MIFWNLSQTLAWIIWRDEELVEKYEEEPEWGISAEIFYGDHRTKYEAEEELLNALKERRVIGYGIIRITGDIEEIEFYKWQNKVFSDAGVPLR